MGITTQEVISDQEQVDGRRVVKYRFIFSEGPTIYWGPKIVTSIFNTSSDMASVSAFLETDQKNNELFLSEQRAIAGEDFNDIKNSLIFNTTAEAAGFILKRMSNRFQEINKRSVYSHLPELFLLRKIWTELTDLQISGFMAEIETDVSSWRASYTTMKNGITDYSSPFETYTDVPEI